jgi:Fe2+ or Zn2+ uptake regulation protein
VTAGPVTAGPAPPGPAARLRSAGLRATGRRVAVLEALARVGGHRTADDVGQALAATGAAVPRASLYHVLGSLATAGVILVADAGPGATRYELAGTWHHHLVCRSCGSVTDVPCVRGKRPCLEPDLSGVIVDQAQVIFRGTCAACAARVVAAES